ncbi:MAG: SUF system Fe-S cluster assembly protein [Nevskia sp.]|nr:SUF system Fe-S cluster assembly protein [Nevskia sp.]
MPPVETSAVATETPPAATVGTWTPDGVSSPPPNEDAVIAACQTVFDPEIPVSIYELGLIYAIEIGEDGLVKVEMTLTAPGCPSAQELPMQVREAIMAVDGVSECDIEVVWDPPWDPSRMSDDARLSLNMF